MTYILFLFCQFFSLISDFFAISFFTSKTESRYLGQQIHKHMPDRHEADSKEKAQSSSKVGHQCVKVVDVSLLGHLHGRADGPEWENKMVWRWKSAFPLPNELVLVVDARPVTPCHLDNSVIIKPGKVPSPAENSITAWTWKQYYLYCWRFSHVCLSSVLMLIFLDQGNWQPTRSSRLWWLS